MLNFLQFPTKGEILIDGKRINKGKDCLEWRRKMALVFQEPLLFKGSVEENIAYGLKIRKYPPGEREEKIKRVLDLLKISNLRKKKSSELSGGEAQRVNLARSLVLEPEIFLLDEPLVNIDTPTRDKFLNDLKQLFNKLTLTVIYVTHVRQEALFLANRVGIMISGKIVQEGSPEEVFNFPLNEDVAKFVGVETVLSGKVIGSGNGMTLVDVNDWKIKVAADGYGEGDVFLCIRPEEIILSNDETHTSARNNFKTKVEKIYHYGHFLKILLDAGFPLIAFITRNAARELALSEGKDVWASFKATSIHLIKR
ncbi:MAG: ABC transporter ATP-binding protein [Actinomycetia bacterium]|nr:ABC transporter ATP-binding protein [Actinomycetes bacterium]